MENQNNLWQELSFQTRLNILSGESTVSMGLLAENEELMRMVIRGDSKENCLDFINENW